MLLLDTSSSMGPTRRLRQPELRREPPRRLHVHGVGEHLCGLHGHQQPDDDAVQWKRRREPDGLREESHPERGRRVRRQGQSRLRHLRRRTKLVTLLLPVSQGDRRGDPADRHLPQRARAPLHGELDQRRRLVLGPAASFPGPDGGATVYTLCRPEATTTASIAAPTLSPRPTSTSG